MKRRLAATLMAACMVTGLLAGCGDSSADNAQNSTDTSNPPRQIQRRRRLQRIAQGTAQNPNFQTKPNRLRKV